MKIPDIMIPKGTGHKRVHTVRFHFYRVIKQDKLIYNGKKVEKAVVSGGGYY